jgi:hypothetical protein
MAFYIAQRVDDERFFHGWHGERKCGEIRVSAYAVNGHLPMCNVTKFVSLGAKKSPLEAGIVPRE